MKYYLNAKKFDSIDDVIEEAVRITTNENIKRALSSKWFEYELKALLYDELYRIAKAGFEVYSVAVSLGTLWEYIYCEVQDRTFNDDLFSFEY